MDRSSDSAAATEYLTLKQVAAYANTSVYEVRKWIYRSMNPLPSAKWGKGIKIRKSDVDQFLDRMFS